MRPANTARESRSRPTASTLPRGDPRALMEPPARAAAMPPSSWRSRLPMPPRWCRTSPIRPIPWMRAMGTGYGWREGPFELIDRLGGAGSTARLEAAARWFRLPGARAEKGGSVQSFNGRRLEPAAERLGIEPVTQSEDVLVLSELRLAGKPMEKLGCWRPSRISVTASPAARSAPR